MIFFCYIFFFKQKTAYEMRISDWSSDVCSSDLQNAIGAEIYDAFKTYDVGDIIGVRGTVFKTKTGELSVKAQQIELLVKGIRPLPEKWAGLDRKSTRLSSSH